MPGAIKGESAYPDALATSTIGARASTWHQLGIPDHTQLSGFWHIAHHHRQRLACSMLAFTQLVNRAVVAGITSQVKSSDSLDSKNLPVSQ